MRRKVIQIAESTQLVSLPRKWALKYGIKKGDEVDVEEKGAKIMISTDKLKDSKEISIDVTGLDRTSILLSIQSLYRLGYDQISVKFDNLTVHHLRTDNDIKVISVINYTVGRLMGFEVVQQKESSCLIKSLQDCSMKEFEQVLKRIFILLIDIYTDLLEGIKTNNKSLVESTEEKHDNITRFVSYCLRTLNKVDYPNYGKALVLYHIVSNIDKIIDVFKYASRDFLKHPFKLSKEGISILEMIKKSLELYQNLFYKHSVDTIKKLSLNRDEVIKSLRKTAPKLKYEEILFLSDLRSALEILLDLTEAKWGLEY